MKNLYSFAAQNYLKLFAGLLLSLPISAIAQESMRVNLYVVDNSGSTLVDGNLTNYSDMYSNAVDINDAWKISNPGINFGIVREGYDLVVERRSIIGKADTTYFKMWNMPQYKYRFKFMLKNLNHTGLSAKLKDNFTQTETAISLNDTTYVDFAVNSDAGSKTEKRFQLIFKKTVTPVDVQFAAVDAQRSGNDVKLNWGVTNEITVESYVIEHSADEINFSQLREQAPENSASFNTYNYEYAEASTAANYYRIKAINAGGRIQYSRIAKIDAINTTTGITVYPNPVVNKTVQLQLNNVAEGKYSFVLLYNNGVTKQLSSVQVNARQSKFSVNLPASITTGIYHLRITGPDGKNSVKAIQVFE